MFKLQIAINETRTCLEGQINPSKIKEELEEAKKTGSMDEVFGKYCNKRQDYKDCIFKTVNVTKECLEEVEINHINAAVKVIEEIADFACYRDGDRLASKLFCRTEVLSPYKLLFFSVCG